MNELMNFFSFFFLFICMLQMTGEPPNTNLKRVKTKEEVGRS